MVDLKFRECRKSKRESIVIRLPYLLRVLPLCDRMRFDDVCLIFKLYVREI